MNKFSEIWIDFFHGVRELNFCGRKNGSTISHNIEGVLLEVSFCGHVYMCCDWDKWINKVVYNFETHGDAKYSLRYSTDSMPSYIKQSP